MPLLRAIGLVGQAAINHLAATPPTRPTPSAKAAAPNDAVEPRKYHTEAWWFFRIAPAMLTLHTILAWIISATEVVLAMGSSGQFFEGASALFFFGWTLSIVGGIMRLVCFKALGEMFTFDLTVHPKHRLITHSLYAYVRHPAYTGSLLMVFGLGTTHLLCPEALVRQVLGSNVCYMLCGMWWVWLSGVGFSRVKAEDEEMHQLFGEEWEEYARKVKWWYIPGVI